MYIEREQKKMRNMIVMVIAILIGILGTPAKDERMFGWLGFMAYQTL